VLEVDAGVQASQHMHSALAQSPVQRLPLHGLLHHGQRDPSFCAGAAAAAALAAAVAAAVAAAAAAVVAFATASAICT
jgi:hypothetical protein